MSDNFSVKRAVDGIANQYQMPSTSTERTFSSKREQMAYWLSDPILRPEAEAWADQNGWPLEYDEYGSPIGFAKDEPDVDADLVHRNRRLA